jgi:hypothetical protein
MPRIASAFDRFATKLDPDNHNMLPSTTINHDKWVLAKISVISTCELDVLPPACLAVGESRAIALLSFKIMDPTISKLKELSAEIKAEIRTAIKADLAVKPGLKSIDIDLGLITGDADGLNIEAIVPPSVTTFSGAVELTTAKSLMEAAAMITTDAVVTTSSGSAAVVTEKSVIAAITLQEVTPLANGAITLSPTILVVVASLVLVVSMYVRRSIS